jgi:hypothetical protein
MLLIIQFISHVFENKILRKIFGRKRKYVNNIENYVTRAPFNYTGDLILLEQ